jgi:hypothetical protein
MQKMVIFIKANTYNTSNLSKLGPRVVAHIMLSHPNGCGVPHLGLGVMSHKCLFAGPWGLIVECVPRGLQDSTVPGAAGAPGAGGEQWEQQQQSPAHNQHHNNDSHRERGSSHGAHREHRDTHTNKAARHHT